MRTSRATNICVAAALLAAICETGGCVAVLDGDPSTGPSDSADLRERWIEQYGYSPEAIHPTAAVAHDKKLRDLMEAYHEEVVIQPWRRGQLHFVVLDEEGRPLDGVVVEVRLVRAPDPFATEPVMTKEEITVNKEYSLKWQRVAYGLGVEMDLKKDGYRTIKVAFTPEPDNAERFENAERMLEEGRVLPPAKNGGPIRIVMPPALSWNPSSPGDVSDGPYTSPDRERWPKVVPADAPVVVTSRSPRKVTAPVRGTYALTDSSGKILDVVQLDQGIFVGFQPVEDIRTHAPGLLACEGGSAEVLPLQNAPYEWRLYSKPKPRTPATQPADP